MKSSQDFRSFISRELLDLAYKNLLLSSVVTLINSLVLSYLLWDVIDHSYVTTWLTLILLVTFIRYLSAFVYHKNHQYYTIERWDQIFMLGTLIAALLWGSLAIFLFPSTIEYQSVLIIIVVGTGAGATSSLSSHLMASRIFLVAPILARS